MPTKDAFDVEEVYASICLTSENFGNEVRVAYSLAEEKKIKRDIIRLYAEYAESLNKRHFSGGGLDKHKVLACLAAAIVRARPIIKGEKRGTPNGNRDFFRFFPNEWIAFSLVFSEICAESDLTFSGFGDYTLWTLYAIDDAFNGRTPRDALLMFSNVLYHIEIKTQGVAGIHK